jgi:hypothetical protein
MNNKKKFNISEAEKTEKSKEHIEQDLKKCTRCKKEYHKKCFEKNKEKTEININEKNESQIKSVSQRDSLSLSLSLNLNLIKLENNDICSLCHDSITTKIKNTKISDYFKPSKNKGINLNEKMILLKNNNNNEKLKSDILMFDFEEDKKY